MSTAGERMLELSNLSNVSARQHFLGIQVGAGSNIVNGIEVEFSLAPIVELEDGVEIEIDMFELDVVLDEGVEIIIEDC